MSEEKQSGDCKNCNNHEKKQIEEMALILKDVPPIEFPAGSRMQGKHIYSLKKFAEAIYNADYRKQEWISVDERLPEENGRYLACIKISHLAFDIPPMVVIMEYNKIHGFDTISGEETVTHWMPLPEAPKMKNTEN